MTTGNLQAVSFSLFKASQQVYWDALPIVLLLVIAGMYVSGDISGGKLEGIFRKLLFSILLIVAFPRISQAIGQIEIYLINAFGNDTSLTDIFNHVADKGREIKDEGLFNWLKIGQAGLSIISTLSFLVLAFVKKFLDVLHICTWNLLNIFGPVAMLGCLSPGFIQIPKGIFMGLFELALWKPIWVVLARILLAIGFGESPTGPSDWFDIAIMNFAVAALMASTPAMAHAILTGTLASVGGSAMQTMVSGVGVALARVPMSAAQSATRFATNKIAGAVALPLRGLNKSKPATTTENINPKKN